MQSPRGTRSKALGDDLTLFLPESVGAAVFLA